MGPRFASVVLLQASMVHKDRVFTYAIPEDLSVGVGSVVRVPLAGARTTGVVVALLDASDHKRTLPIQSTMGPGIDASGVGLARWLADRYLCTFGEALQSVLPERVAAVEKESAPDPLPEPAQPDFAWADGWSGVQQIIRAAGDPSGSGAFSLQPLAADDRGPMIASLVATAVRAGRGVLIVLADVSTRSRVAASVQHALGESVAWLSSDQSARDRYRGWLALRRGDRRVAAGGRAAALAPVERLGLVIVDDESHAGHKERRAPRFHARSVAAERARRAGAVLVAVGVPPSVEVIAAAASGHMRVAAPPRRSQMRHRPPVTVVDLVKQPERLVPAGRTLAAARVALDAGERVVILTHKGGDEPARILERATRVLKVREAARIDATTSDVAMRRALEHAQLIVATPVIAKDVAIDRLGLLGICHADAALSHTDFRTPEEAFATWWRAAHAAKAVVIETARAGDDAVRALVRFDPSALAAAETRRRRELGYPPFAQLARIVTTLEHAGVVVKMIADAGGTTLGPVERAGAAVIAVKAPDRAALEALLAPLVAAWRAAEAPVRIDVDPRQIL